VLEDASHCYIAARSCDVRPLLALSGVPAGLLPKPVVGWITHHRPGVGVLEPNHPARQVCVIGLCSGYWLWQQRGEGTPMATIAGADGRRITVCAACGYPRLGPGLCAACIQSSSAVPVDPAMNTVAGVADLDPAA
jgi:hypothetical protein